MVHPIEQRRRDLKGTDPEFYDYIAAVEASKIYDSAGDIISGLRSGHDGANRLWAMAMNARRRVARARGEH